MVKFPSQSFRLSGKDIIEKSIRTCIHNRWQRLRKQVNDIRALTKFSILIHINNYKKFNCIINEFKISFALINLNSK
jgi:hypothetical protein